MGIEKPRKQSFRGRGLLRRRQLIAGHLAHRFGAKNLCAAVLAAVEQHARKYQIVIDSGYKPTRARGKHRRRRIGAFHTVLVHTRFVTRRTCEISATGEAVELFRRHKEAGVVHAKRTGDALAHEDIEILLRRALDQHPLQEATGIVHPAFTRLMHQRQRGKARHPFVGRMRRYRHGLTVHQLQFVDALLDWRIVEEDAEPKGESEKIAHRDVAPCRQGLVDRTIEMAQYAAVGQLRQPAQRRLVHFQATFLDQHQSHRRQ